MAIKPRCAQLSHWLLVLVVRGVGGVVGVLATIAASRWLGAEQAGLVFLALSIVTVLAAFSRQGLDQTLVRFISVYASQGQWAHVVSLFRIAQIWVARLSLTVALLLFVCADLVAENVFQKTQLGPVLRVMVWLIPFMALYWQCAQCFIGIRKPEIATTLQNNLLPLGFIALMYVGLDVSFPLNGAILGAAAYTLAGAMTLSVGWGLWWTRAWHSTPSVVVIERSAIRHSSNPLWIVVLMNQLIMWGGQIIGGIWLPADEIAYLAAAQRCALLVGLILIIVGMFVSPKFASLHSEGNYQALENVVHRVGRLLLFIATPIALTIVFLSVQVMAIFGEGFEASAPLLRILVLGQWVNAVTGSVGILLVMTGHERDMRNINLACGVFSIFVTVGLTIYAGVEGTALAMALTMVAQNVLAVVFVKRRLGIVVIGRWSTVRRQK